MLSGGHRVDERDRDAQHATLEVSGDLAAVEIGAKGHLAGERALGPLELQDLVLGHGRERPIARMARMSPSTDTSIDSGSTPGSSQLISTASPRRTASIGMRRGIWSARTRSRK